MIGQMLEIPFGSLEGSSAVKLSQEAQNGDKMQIVRPESCVCQKISVPLRSQSTAERKMKPLIKYRGGKSKEIPLFGPYIPHFTGRYIEPFLGGGALFFHLSPTKAIVNDINANLYNFYVGIRDNFHQVRAELDELEHIYEVNRAHFNELKRRFPNERVADANEALYYHIRNMYNHLIPAEYNPATIYYFINKTAYSGMIRYNAKGEFNVPFGRYPNFNTQMVTAEHSKLLQRTTILNGDFSEAFQMARPNDFIFLDPPYDCAFSDYGNEQYRIDGFGDESHRRLAQDFYNLPCPAMIVIGRTPLTEELYHGHIVAHYNINYAVNIRNRFKSAAQHIIVTNYHV